MKKIVFAIAAIMFLFGCVYKTPMMTGNTVMVELCTTHMIEKEMPCDYTATLGDQIWFVRQNCTMPYPEDSCHTEPLGDRICTEDGYLEGDIETRCQVV